MSQDAAPIAANAKEMPTAGERVRLRKAHPCGGREWIVTRAGADIGLECAICKRRVSLPFDEFLRRCAARAVPAPTPARSVSVEALAAPTEIA